MDFESGLFFLGDFENKLTCGRVDGEPGGEWVAGD